MRESNARIGSIHPNSVSRVSGVSDGYNFPESLRWSELSGPLARAEDTLARLDERLRLSPIREGWIARSHFFDAAASLWLEGELVHVEDLVLHDTRMDIRTPTHELTRAYQVLRARRLISDAEPGWPLSPTGLDALVGRSLPKGDSGRQNKKPEEICEIHDAWDREMAEIDALVTPTSCLLANTPVRQPERDPLVYDLDWEPSRQAAELTQRVGLSDTVHVIEGDVTFSIAAVP